jgi:hypothetical protein
MPEKDWGVCGMPEITKFRAYPRMGLAALAGAVLLAGAAAPLKRAEAPFLAENAAAMDRMMAGMSVKPTGNVDADFVALMEPHHRGAIEMAQAELRYGRNEQLRRIAQEIIVDQQQEIVAMRLAIGLPLPPSAPVPDQQRPATMPGGMGHHY